MESHNVLSHKEAYEVMLRFLHQYWKFTGSIDLTDILSGGEYLSDDLPADPAFWDYWLEAIEETRRDGPLYKELI